VSDFFMFCADRFDHCNSLIGPRLEAGENVLTDRYNLSTYAYQSPILEKELEVWDGVKYIDEVLEDFIIEPDLTILLDLPVERALERKEGDEKEKYEDRERLEQTRKVYRQVANDKDYVEIIDARQEEKEIMWKCYDLIEAL
jgi:dTMP kinase